MSWGFTKEATVEPRTIGTCRGQLAEQLHHLLRKDPVAYRSAVGFGRAMRLAADPAGEPKWVESVSLAVSRDCIGERFAVVVGCHQTLVSARNGEISVRDVPLPPVVGVVTAGPEPVAECRHRIGIEPVHARDRSSAWPRRPWRSRREATGTGR